MIKKTIILLIFLPFYLTSLWGKEYFGKPNEQSGDGAGAAWEKNQE